MNLITCKNLTMRYESSFYALKDLNFHVENGDYLYILGQNGAGKSTLIKGLLQLKKPSSGSIVYGDGLSASDIGYLPQTTQIQKDFPASVREVVLSGCLNQMKLRPFYTHKERALAGQNMERMGITKLRNKCFRELSGGQKQRVLLARALCATRKILLLDEPAAGLDPVVTQEMYELIDTIN
ncbi:MAG: metal ABC transporter ATP-binding protein, partial [Eubacterium sp.]